MHESEDHFGIFKKIENQYNHYKYHNDKAL